jgi:pyrimidine operon attenuation protein/uracil phosphoribosyltransferase
MSDIEHVLSSTVLFDRLQTSKLLDQMAAQVAALMHAGHGSHAGLITSQMPSALLTADAPTQASSALPWCVLGVLRRGAPLADMLCDKLLMHGLRPALRLDLLVKRYADDLTLLHPETRLHETQAQAHTSLQGYHVLVVDDVLYTGHSMLRVVNHLMAKGAAHITLAVLIDRHCTTLPLCAAVVGATVQIAPGDIIDCHVPPYEEELGVHLVKL